MVPARKKQPPNRKTGREALSYLTPEFCRGKGELEGRVEVVLLLVAPVDHLALAHHQEPRVTWVTPPLTTFASTTKKLKATSTIH